MKKPHLFKCGQYWVCAAGRFDHHIMRGSLGATPKEAWLSFKRRTNYAVKKQEDQEYVTYTIGY